MSDHIKITATGSSAASHKAERATMHIRASSEGPSQSTVAQDVTSASNKLQEMFKGLARQEHGNDSATDGAPVLEWTMGSLSTGSYQPWADQGETPKPRVHTASTALEATFADLGALGRVATELLDLPHVEVDSISWDVMAATRAALGRQTRRGAVEDAIAKAGDYAAATGRTRVVPYEISDEDAAGSRQPFMAMAKSRAARGGGAGEELSFTPETITLESSVVVKFTAIWM